MQYALIQDQQVSQYPLTEVDIKRLFPQTSFASPFSPPEGYVAVQATRKPQIDHTQNATEGTPVLSEDRWMQTWEVSQASEDEIATRTQVKAVEVRAERNQLLSESDWSQLPDSPVNKEDWSTYRQALRDVPSQGSFPWQVEWPLSPEE